jgi:hypothetical protein
LIMSKKMHRTGVHQKIIRSSKQKKANYSSMYISYLVIEPIAGMNAHF